jgi:hypothetical protein
MGIRNTVATGATSEPGRVASKFSFDLLPIGFHLRRMACSDVSKEKGSAEYAPLNPFIEGSYSNY